MRWWSIRWWIPSSLLDVPSPGRSRDPPAAPSCAGGFLFSRQHEREESLGRRAPPGWKGAIAASCQGCAGALTAHSAAAMVHVAPAWNKWCLSKCKLQPALPASSALNGSNQRSPNYSRLQKLDLLPRPPQAFKGEGKRMKAVTLAGGLGRPGRAIGATPKGSAMISFHFFPFVFRIT